MFACSNLKSELIVRLHEIDYSSILITRIIMINVATYIALVCTQVVELCHVGTVDKKTANPMHKYISNIIHLFVRLTLENFDN